MRSPRCGASSSFSSSSGSCEGAGGGGGACLGRRTFARQVGGSASPRWLRVHVPPSEFSIQCPKHLVASPAVRPPPALAADALESIDGPCARAAPVRRSIRLPPAPFGLSHPTGGRLQPCVRQGRGIAADPRRRGRGHLRGRRRGILVREQVRGNRRRASRTAPGDRRRQQGESERCPPPPPSAETDVPASPLLEKGPGPRRSGIMSSSVRRPSERGGRISQSYAKAARTGEIGARPRSRSAAGDAAARQGSVNTASVDPRARGGAPASSPSLSDPSEPSPRSEPTPPPSALPARRTGPGPARSPGSAPAPPRPIRPPRAPAGRIPGRGVHGRGCALAGGRVCRQCAAVLAGERRRQGRPGARRRPGQRPDQRRVGLPARTPTTADHPPPFAACRAAAAARSAAARTAGAPRFPRRRVASRRAAAAAESAARTEAASAGYGPNIRAARAATCLRCRSRRASLRRGRR